jgi:RHS repeat-associated protein
MPLTDVRCKTASCPSERVRARFSDSGGLYLEVAATGSKRWFWKYYFDGKEKRLALGSYPDAKLKEAREARDDARRVQQQGLDPAQHSVWRWDTAEPFGATGPNEDPSGLGIFKFNQRFPGQVADSETGLNQNWHREYDGRWGRYRQFDPIGLVGGPNPFLYVGAAPTLAADPYGLFYDEHQTFTRPAAVVAVRNPALAAAALSFLGGVAVGSAIYEAYGTEIQDALEAICGPKNRDKERKKHHGRIQAQGNTTGRDVNVSSAWAQDSPLTKAQGFAHLHVTVNQIPPNQLYRFTAAIAKAANWISTTPTVGPTVRNFYQDSSQRNRRGAERIDIEVWGGLAF